MKERKIERKKEINSYVRKKERKNGVSKNERQQKRKACVR